MKDGKKDFLLSKIKIVFCVLFILFMVGGSFPTGWIYDIGVGTGTNQGQKPSPDVQIIKSREEIHDFFKNKKPAAISSKVFVKCPLMRLRDTGTKGGHVRYVPKLRVRRISKIDEYNRFVYPVNFSQTFSKTFFSGAFYNTYYLAQLEDGSYLCVFFDDYLKLKNLFGNEVELPVGYVRESTKEEQNMLKKMANDYDVDVKLVLDMYRDGKYSKFFDMCLRILLAAVVIFVFKKHSLRVKKKAEAQR